MRTTNPKLAAGLLEAGKREFLEKGFQGASLRNIAASLGVTTGAIYGYYTDKEAMFDALVSEPGQELVERYREVQKAFSARPLEEQVNNLPEVPEIEAAWMMEYIYDHFDAFKRALIDRMREAAYPVPEIDDELIHIMSSALFNGMFETVRHDMPREKAMQYMNSLRDFYSAGWFKILGIT